MMKHETINNVLKVSAKAPFKDFYVLILPMDDAPDDKGDYRSFYLFLKGYAPVLSMFGCAVESNDEALELAYNNIREYIEIYLDEYNI